MHCTVKYITFFYLLLVIVCLPFSVRAMAFSDIDKSIFKDFILRLSQDNVVGGYADGTFRPDDPVSRQQMAKFVRRGFNISEKFDCPRFSDISEGDELFNDIQTLKCVGILSGYENGMFKPKEFISRGAATKLIIKAAEYKSPGIFENIFTIQAFLDISPDYPFAEYINRAASHQIISGYEDSTFRGEEGVTRGAIAKMIDNARKLQNNPKSTILRQSKGVVLSLVANHYVQKINLSEGAKIKLLTGDITDSRVGKGIYGNDDPSFRRQSMNEIWQKFKNADSKAFSTINGAFFRNNTKKSTELAFPIKTNGKLLSDGYAGGSEYGDEKKTLQIWSDRVEITDFSESDPYSKTLAPDAIVTLTKTADKSRNSTLARSFVGIKDTDNDGKYETIFIFSSNAATQAKAVTVLNMLGASDIVMLDGGGSTQLNVQGQNYIQSSRTIPQSIGVVNG